MPRMIDLIRQSAVPPNIMRAAVRGSLSVPAPEMVEILVYLTSQPAFQEQARLTLAGWNINSALTIAADPATPTEVLGYMIAPENLRPNLLPALLENPSVPDGRVADLLAQLPAQQIATALASERVRRSDRVLRNLATNRNLDEAQQQEINRLLTELSVNVEEEPLEIDVSGYLRDHVEELKQAEGQPFHLLDSTGEEEAEIRAVVPEPAVPEPAAARSNDAAPSATAAVRFMKQAKPERESVVQKVARLSVGERVLLAMKGNKDERFILIRDGARIVSNAVLESPKLTDSEIETFAGMKNVSESVLRGITMKRKFMKNYNVTRILTMNPRCPIDVSVPLLSHLLTADLKNLSNNKNVADTVRKIAFKLYRDRLVNR